MSSSLSFLSHPLKLISTLWDSTPNIPIPTSFPTAAVDSMLATPRPETITASEQVLAPHGICGWVSAEPGAAGNFVCQAAGQVMPGVVFLVSLVVVTATLLFLIRYLYRSAALASELEKLAKTIEGIQIAPQEEWAAKDACDKILSALQQSGRTVPPILDLSEKVERSLIPVPSVTDRRMMLKRSVSEITSEIRDVERWSGQALAEALPGWLTGIGLLTTFIAILLGLQGVKVLANLEVRGIGGLVNGLSGKFFSSIIALSCAISITIIQYFISGRTQQRWARLSVCLQERIPHLSIERVFVSLLQSRNSGSGSS